MKTNRFLPVFLAAITAMLALSACYKHGPDGNAPQSYAYETVVFGSSDCVQLTLDKITSALTSVTCSDSWISASALEEKDPQGHPVISIQSGKPGKDGAKATVEAVAGNGDRATITVRHSERALSDGESGANTDWNDSWWLFDTVPIQGFAHAQKTPWTVEGSDNIPEEVRKQVDAKDGWEMAFSYLSDDSLEGVRYFALYNKWSGQMRLYTYVVDPTGWGTDLVLNAYFGTSSDNDMYPFYNLFEYGIPTSHLPGSSLLRSARLLSAQTQTFQTWLSPFRQSRSLTPGWYCFEFDMSGYVPKGKDWLKLTRDSPRFKFFAETDNNQSISLKGTLSGSIEGSFEDPQIIMHGGANAVSGVLSALGGGLSSLSGMASSSISTASAYANVMAHGGNEGFGSFWNPVKYWGGFACGIAGGLLSLLAPEMEDETSYEIIPGKIDLTLDATIELDGYIRAATGNNLRGLSVSPQGIFSSNGENGHVGKGVWSLAEDPVVYIDTEDIISTQQNFNLTIKEDGYFRESFSNYDARLVYALDPTSVKVNINEDLFHGIQDVTVTTNVGVFPNYPYGHTDSYRRMLMLKDRPSFSLAEGKTSGTLELSGKSVPCITRIGLDDLCDGEYETPENCSIVAQKKADGTEWQRYHGRLIDIPELGKQIIVDPYVYIPYTTDDDGNCTGIGYPTAPDFVVRVDLEFTALDDKGERKLFQFGKLYIPRIELVDYDGMCEVSGRLKDYSAQCEANQPVNNLANDSKVPVRFPGGHLLIGKTLRILDAIGM